MYNNLFLILTEVFGYQKNHIWMIVKGVNDPTSKALQLLMLLSTTIISEGEGLSREF